MKLTKASSTLAQVVLVALAAIASPFAVADSSNWYGGVNVGQSRAKIDDAKISKNLLGAGITTTSISDDDRDTGYKLFGGYQFNKNFALEGGYFDLGKFGFNAATTAPGSLNGNIKLKGVNFDAVGTLPVIDKLSAFGRVGINYAEAKDSFSGTGAISVLNANPSKRDTNYKFGVGLQYDITESLGMRVEAERYRVNDAVGNKGDIDLVSAGLIYRFGEKAPVPQAAAPQPVAVTPKAAAPEPVAVAPEPVAPAPVAAPAAVAHRPLVTRIVTFSADSSADSLFDFDKAKLKPAGQHALDKFASGLKGADFEVITVTGHSDRFGTHAYNMKLSMHRAAAVKAYLVKSAKIPAFKIATKAVDGAHPVTKPGKCKGKKATKKLIACTAPDRRVEVEVKVKVQKLVQK